MGIIVVGCQWGDEGKGKIIDVFSSHADFVVRFQGGANAGHTLVVNGQKTVLHLVPSGVLHSEPTCIIAPGVVVDVEGLVEEIRDLKKMGYLQSSKKLLLSDTASILLPYHKVLDQAREEALLTKKLGTTGKGIGPAYEDRASRRGLIVADLFEPATLREKLELALAEKNILLEHHYKKPKVDINGFYERLLSFLAKTLHNTAAKMSLKSFTKRSNLGRKFSLKEHRPPSLTSFMGLIPMSLAAPLLLDRLAQALVSDQLKCKK